MGYEGTVRKLHAPSDGQALVIAESDTPPLDVALSGAALDRINMFQEAALADRTRDGYERDWKQFVEFCHVNGYHPLPAHPLAVADYLASAAEIPGEDGKLRKASTIARWLAAINKAHENSGYFTPGSFPDVKKTMAGIRRKLNRDDPIKRAAPLLLDQLRAIILATDITSFPRGVTGTRDIALLLMGFAGAFRRSELTGLQLRDVTVHPQDGLHITLRSSKTDKASTGLVTALPYGTDPVTCPVCAYVRWLRVSTMMRSAARGPLMALLREQDLTVHVCHEPLPEHPSLIPTRPLFQPLSSNGRTSKQTPIDGTAVMDAVTNGLTRIGVDPTPYGAHSLRAGFVTQALRNGATLYEVMKQTHHTRVDTVSIYDRQNNPLMNNAVTKVGL